MKAPRTREGGQKSEVGVTAQPPRADVMGDRRRSGGGGGKYSRWIGCRFG